MRGRSGTNVANRPTPRRRPCAGAARRLRPGSVARTRRASTGAISYDRTESRSDSGWTYSEQDGQGTSHSWNDTPPPVHEHSEGYWDGQGDGRSGPPCPPPQGAYGCAGDSPADPPHPARRDPPQAYADGAGQWQDGSYGQVYPVTGRDAQGYLVWPGKTPQ